MDGGRRHDLTWARLTWAWQRRVRSRQPRGCPKLAAPWALAASTPPSPHSTRPPLARCICPLRGRTPPAAAAGIACTARHVPLIRTEAVTEITLRFYSFHLRFLSLRSDLSASSQQLSGVPVSGSSDWSDQCCQHAHAPQLAPAPACGMRPPFARHLPAPCNCSRRAIEQQSPSISWVQQHQTWIRRCAQRRSTRLR
jgi:hypothetical protein